MLSLRGDEDRQIAIAPDEIERLIGERQAARGRRDLRAGAVQRDRRTARNMIDPVPRAFPGRRARGKETPPLAIEPGNRRKVNPILLKLRGPGTPFHPLKDQFGGRNVYGQGECPNESAGERRGKGQKGPKGPKGPKWRNTAWPQPKKSLSTQRVMAATKSTTRRKRRICGFVSRGKIRRGLRRFS